MPVTAAEQRRDRKCRDFLAKLRADLLFLGANRYQIAGLKVGELIALRQRLLRQHMETAPKGARWDV